MRTFLARLWRLLRHPEPLTLPKRLTSEQVKALYSLKNKDAGRLW